MATAATATASAPGTGTGVTHDTHPAGGKSDKFETPFTTAALGADVGFWRSYISGRPAPDEEFFQRINAYHAEHSRDGAQEVAHDVGTGPGNIATRLARYYAHVVGSDVNGEALAAAPALAPPEAAARMTFVQSGAERLGDEGIVPHDLGRGCTDLVTVSECMPLLDAPEALNAFHALLKPGGTLAIYFYGRPVFADNESAQADERCNALYDRAATRTCQFLLPFKGTPGFPFHQRGAEGLVSFLDNIAFPSNNWQAVERFKWNSDHPLLFNGPEGFDFDLQYVDRRAQDESTREIHDRTFWQDTWDVDRVENYLLSVFPNVKAKAGDKYKEVQAILDELRDGMGNKPRKVTFSAVLILATRK